MLKLTILGPTDGQKQFEGIINPLKIKSLRERYKGNKYDFKIEPAENMVTCSMCGEECMEVENLDGIMMCEECIEITKEARRILNLLRR